MKTFILAALLAVISTVSSYPMFKQCDSRWGTNPLGNWGGETICSAGCTMSSLAMILSQCNTLVWGNPVTPANLNQFLKANGGFVQGNLLVFAASDVFQTAKFVTKTANAGSIQWYLDNGHAAILNIDNGAHWVLSYGYSGSTFYVNDPYYDRKSYQSWEIVDSAIYKVPSSCLGKKVSHHHDSFLNYVKLVL